jgi:hypothetical protein
MTPRSQLRLYFHGSLFIALAMGLATLPLYTITLRREFLDTYRQFVRQSHLILVLTGIWMLASGAMLPLLDLTQRSISITVWSLVSSGYTFLLAIALLAVVLFEVQQSSNPPLMDIIGQAPYYLGYIYLTVLTISGILSFVPGVIIVSGAHKALRQHIQDAIH